MPIYEYKCNVCSATIEYERSFGDDTEPTCCQTTMSRVWSATPVHFKGGGFYSTGG